MAVSWAYLAVVGGSLLSGGFDSKEACYGHRDVLQEQKIYGKCVDLTVTISGETFTTQTLSSSSGTYGVTTGGSSLPVTSAFCTNGSHLVGSSNGNYVCSN